jgi:hypothetical protein
VNNTNFDRSTVVVYNLPVEVPNVARIRFEPTAWSGHISMRVGYNYDAVEANTDNKKFCRNSEIELSKAAVLNYPNSPAAASATGPWTLPGGLTLLQDKNDPVNNTTASSYTTSMNTIKVTTDNASSMFTIGNASNYYSSYTRFIRTSNDARTLATVLINGESANASICQGGSITLSASSFWGTESAWEWVVYTGQMATTYLSTPNTSQSPTFTNIQLAPGTYNVRYRVKEDCCGWSRPMYNTFTVVPDPTPPTITKTALSNYAEVCEGAQGLSVVATGGSGGTGTCWEEYRYKNTTDASFSIWSKDVPVLTAGTANGNKVFIQAKRACDGGGCVESSTVEVTWDVVAQPEHGEPVLVDPSNDVICAGTLVGLQGDGASFEFYVTGGTGGINSIDKLQYIYIDADGILQYPWRDYNGPFAPDTLGEYIFRTWRVPNGLGCVNSDTSLSNILSQPYPDRLFIVQDGPYLRTNHPSGRTLYRNDFFSEPEDTFYFVNEMCDIADWDAYYDAYYLEFFNMLITENSQTQPTTYDTTKVFNIAVPFNSQGCDLLYRGYFVINPIDPSVDPPVWDWTNWDANAPPQNLFNVDSGTVIIQAQLRDCGGNCDSSAISEVRYSIAHQPESKSIIKIPNNTDVCVSGQVSATFTGGRGGIGLIEDIFEYSLDGWQTFYSYTPGTIVPGPYPLNGTVEIRTWREADGFNCNPSVPVTVSWDVVGEPVPPTINTANPSAGSTLCNGASISATFNAGSGGGGTYCDDFIEISTDGTNWSAFTSPYTTVGTGTVTIRTRRVCDGNCSQENYYTWTVTQPLAITSEPQNFGLCAAGSMNISVAVTNAPGAGVAYQWQQSSAGCGSGWSNVGSNSNTYTVAGNASTRYYRAIVTQSVPGCADTKLTNCITVTSTEPLPPTITAIPAPNSTICKGSEVDITFTPGTGGGSNCLDVVEYSNDGGTTWLPYNAPLTATVTGTLKLKRSRNCAGNCSDSEEDSWTVTDVLEITNQPQDESVSCSDDSKVLSVAFNQHTGATITRQWKEFSTAGCSGSGANVGSNSNSYTVTNINNTMYYNVVIIQGGSGCNDTVTSNCVEVIFNEPVAPVIVFANPPVNSTMCQGDELVVSVSNGTGGSGTCVDKVEYKIDNGTWAAFVSPFTSSIAGTIYVRTVRTCDGVCVSADTSEWTITEDNFEIVNHPADDEICTGGSTTLSVTYSGATGTVSYQWIESAVGCSGPWDPISGATSSTYVVSGITGTMYYGVILTDQSTGSCNTELSNCATVTISTGTSSGLVWEGDVSDDWFDPDNWGGGCNGGGSIPTANDEVIIPAYLDPANLYYPRITNASPLDTGNPKGKAVCKTIKLGVDTPNAFPRRVPTLTIETGAELKVNNQ